MSSKLYLSHGDPGYKRVPMPDGSHRYQPTLGGHELTVVPFKRASDALKHARNTQKVYRASQAAAAAGPEEVSDVGKSPEGQAESQ